MAVKQPSAVINPLIKTIGSKIDRGICLMVYAEPGVGKTTLASTLPVGNTLIINTEAGVGPLLGTGHSVLDINEENVALLPELYKTIKTEGVFDYVVMDNVSQLEQWVLLHCTHSRTKKFPELREYDDTAVMMRALFTEWRDLTCDGITVIFNAWEMSMDEKQDVGFIKTRKYPKMGKKLTKDVCGLVDIVARLEVNDKTGARALHIGASADYITKTQFKGLDAYEPADLPMLLDKLRGYDYSPKGGENDDVMEKRSK